jgi:hypothetical protein
VACAHVQPATVKAHALCALPGFPTSGFGRRPERNIGAARMPKRIIIMVVCALMVVAAAYATWASGFLKTVTDNSHGAIAACEGNIKAGLIAPSTYHRIRADYHEQPPLSLEEYTAYERTQYCGLGDLFEPCTYANAGAIAYAGQQILERRGVQRPTARERDEARAESIRANFATLNRRPAAARQTATVFIEFDAQNAFGAPIRNTRMCRFGPMLSDGFHKGDLFDPPNGGLGEN